ncbi:30S ribosomal protein S6 [Metamycoplasma alkalescens]|uniref:Small ribosomal subunit protein bS6 n=1 Tax=Metamycoplasma alkalescens TaxID=45363 RepID=A0A318U8F6_9BACT|nr:30S ribosomal protein S6 [Metamycoplasma alkalescens]PYF43694.1 small subunit ribosomal protein S6 [Metamycoplasma alkalescens]SYV90675.1 ribosomal protein S6 [Metamycoplasma alkalescens]
MSKYEIMILVNPTSKEESVKELLFSVLDEKNTKFERLERTELAYPIKKLNRASYFLVLTKTEPESIKELTRKFNIDKTILRSLVINLDSEKGLKPRKQKRFQRRNFDNKKPFERHERKETTTEDKKHEIKKESTKNKEVE